MAFTRKYLKGLGLSDEQIEAVMDAHIEVTDAQKATINELTTKAEKVDNLQKKVDELNDNADWKAKYETKDKEFSDYKKGVEAKERETAVKAAYRKLLIEEHVGDRQLDAVIRATNFADMKLNSDGTLDNADKLKEDIKTNWGGFIVTETTKGAQGAAVATPPAAPGAGGANSRAAELAKRYHEQRYGAKPQQNS